jgi:PAS domain S-box-containing protein
LKKDQTKELLAQIHKIKYELESLVKAFDTNVIFSKTDLNGKITHASEAFCKISGYKVSELIGQPHSIIRHPDMPSEVFKELWESLHKTLHWSGEVKNRRKDGSFYWVFSKIEPDYNSHGEHIGYHAVREDITSKKEVEELSKELEKWNTHLESQMTQRIREIIILNKDIKETQKEVLFTMGTIAEHRSKETGNHVKRVASYTKILALSSGIPEEEAEMLKQASPMHDIGKVAIPDAVLNKPGGFDENERKIMDSHPKLGFDMLKHSERELLKMAAIVAYQHHEKWDGSGYPNALKGEEIHIYGRITALADVFDALASDRIYKKAWDLERIIAFFKEQKGKHFDPQLVDIFFENLNEFLAIRDEFVD